MTRLDVTFGAFQARQGGGASAVDRRANCLLTIAAVRRDGYTFGVDSILLRGHATLSAGTVGSAAVHSWFVGQADTGTTHRSINGPFNGAWRIRQAVPRSSIVWMPCDAGYPLNLNLTVNIGSAGSRSGATGRISMAADTDEPSASFHFAWERC